MRPTITDYWRDAAFEWDESSYARRLRGLPLVERLATLQRAHIRERGVTAERRLAPWIEGKTFLEIGMGGGELLVRLLELGAAAGTGIDVSPQVVELACARARDAGVGDRATVVAGTIDSLDGPTEPDLLVGLGIIEYLHPAELTALLDRVRPKDIFLSFDEKQWTLKKALHAAYRQAKRLPYYKKYREAEIEEILGSCGYSNVRVFREGANSFVTTLE